MALEHKCDECGVACDDAWQHNTCDGTPTDRGWWWQESTEYFCEECFHVLFLEEE